MTTRTVPNARSTDEPVADLAAYDGLTADLSKVDDGECLYCYLLRMLDVFGCRDGHRFTKQWIKSQRGRNGWVLSWVRKGGGFCDCEVIFNVFRDDLKSERHRQLRCETSYLAAADADDADDPDDPDDLDDAEDPYD